MSVLSRASECVAWLQLTRKTHLGGLVAVEGDGDVAVVGLEQNSGGRALGRGCAGGGSCSRSAVLRWRGRRGCRGCRVSLGRRVRRAGRRRRRVGLVVLEDLLELVHCAGSVFWAV